MVRVLVTRPEPAAGTTIRKLADLGFEAVRLPLFEVTQMPLPPALAEGGFAAIAFTSRNGVASVSAHEARTGRRQFTGMNIPAYVVGRATAEAASLAGFTDVRTGDGAARELAALIISDCAADRLQVNAGSPLLYVAGVERKPDFEDRLGEGGITVRTVDAYRMNEISYSTDFLNSGDLSPFPDCVLLYSANAARRFGELFFKQAGGMAGFAATFVCLSQDVLAGLPPELQERAVVADAPNEAALLERLAAIH